MPLLPNWGYVENSEKPYEYETSYYLDFHIFSALISLQYLESHWDGTVWNNKCQYYHYYTDHLLFSLGQITNRFIVTNNDDKQTQKRKESNQKNYLFTKDQYPIISKKQPRNVVEHIDIRDQRIITNKRGVGGFCVIDEDITPELEKALRNNRPTQPYTLDLKQKQLLIRDRNNNLEVNLEDLKQELLSLQTSVKSFIEAMESPTIIIE